MISHITFSEHKITAASAMEKQKEIRDKAAQFINEKIGPNLLLEINEMFLPEEGLFAVTVWYHLPENVAAEKLQPEEASAELLSRKIQEVRKDPIDMLADERMLRGHG